MRVHTTFHQHHPLNTIPSTPSAMIARCTREIEALHVFFQKWLNGAIPGGAEELRRVEEALSDAFVMISPDAGQTPRDVLLQHLRSSHGTWQEGRIWIENVQGRSLSEELALVTYEEWQQTGEEVRGRRSSALFRRAPAAPEGVAWVHLHETWIPADGAAE